jgi:hypothetical protein
LEVSLGEAVAGILSSRGKDPPHSRLPERAPTRRAIPIFLDSTALSYHPNAADSVVWSSSFRRKVDDHTTAIAATHSSRRRGFGVLGFGFWGVVKFCRGQEKNSVRAGPTGKPMAALDGHLKMTVEVNKN